MPTESCLFKLNNENCNKCFRRYKHIIVSIQDHCGFSQLIQWHSYMMSLLYSRLFEPHLHCTNSTHHFYFCNICCVCCFWQILLFKVYSLGIYVLHYVMVCLMICSLLLMNIMFIWMFRLDRSITTWTSTSVSKVSICACCSSCLRRCSSCCAVRLETCFCRRLTISVSSLFFIFFEGR